MRSNLNLSVYSDWEQKAKQYWEEKNYSQAAKLYEAAIEREPDVKSLYWDLGLMLLLQGQEVEAQTTWFLAMTEGEPDQVEQWTQELIQVLETEAERQRITLADCTTAWIIRQHIREINPTDINNLLHLVGLSTLLNTYSDEVLVELGILELFKSNFIVPEDVNNDLLLEVLNNVLDQAPQQPLSYELVETTVHYLSDVQSYMGVLVPVIYQLAYSRSQHHLAIKFIEQGLKFSPQHPELWRCLSTFYQDIGEYAKGIEVAKHCYSVMDNFPDQVYATFLLLRGLMSAGGRWTEFCTTIENYQLMLNRLLEEKPTLAYDLAVRSFSTTFFFPYYQDQPRENYSLRRQVSEFIQSNIETQNTETVKYCRGWKSRSKTNILAEKRLNIGYVSHCLRNHSVGWLARGLFQHHDHDKFKIHSYLFAAQKNHNEVQSWYISKSDKAHKLGLDGKEVAKVIYDDEIDILVDLDSLTLTSTCETLALKPAPIQVTWLGWDASSVPSVDYFMADPYVLPEDAQDYYQETIWRLPNTYLAVDGFEIAIPSLRRDELGVSNDAILYFTAQRGYKYNPDTAKLQLQILKAVPNSYFLIKGMADQESLKTFYAEIAESVGVDCDRLKLLPLSPTEASHRANLAIADVVLDTYPYNGATTTMETLWMGVPMVTKVGQQFAARNSYTMMMNAGITEGIAWTDEEYVEWGIKLGTDENLRQQISWKLRKNRQMAPLWNGKQFTREMENAYEQMWQKYIEGKN
jgi:predicted O-linked N-acetylglucosamine transferase (SPINDLY family)